MLRERGGEKPVCDGLTSHPGGVMLMAMLRKLKLSAGLVSLPGMVETT